MRIREILFRDFPAFRGERRITFTDSLTDSVQPVTILAGSNGSGKTTILDTIEALPDYVLEPDNRSDLISEAFETSLICMQVELSARELTGDDEQPGMLDFLDIGAPSHLHIVVGRRDLTPGHQSVNGPIYSVALFSAEPRVNSSCARTPWPRSCANPCHSWTRARRSCGVA